MLRDRVRYLSKAWLVVVLLFFVTSVEVRTYCEYNFLNTRVNAKTLRAQSPKNFMISLQIFRSDNFSGQMVELTRRMWEASKNVRTTAKG